MYELPAPGVMVICDGKAGEVTTRSCPTPLCPGLPGWDVKVPVIVVRAPAVTTAVWQAGVSRLATAPKHTVCDPVGTSVHMPQLLVGLPSTLIWLGTAGEVITLSDPRWGNVPVSVVVAPEFTVTVRQGASVQPSTWVNPTAGAPAAML